MLARWASTELANAYPLLASQLMDQVIAPRMSGQRAGGTKLPQRVPAARQLSASFTTDGFTYPPPAAWVVAGRPSATWSGRSSLWSWMHDSAVRKFTVP